MQETTTEDSYSPFVAMPLDEATFNTTTSEQSALDEIEKILLDNSSLDELLMLDFSSELAQPDGGLNFVDFSSMLDNIPLIDSVFLDSTGATSQDESFFDLSLFDDQPSSLSSFSTFVDSPSPEVQAKPVTNRPSDRVEKISLGGISKNKLAAQKYRSKKLQQRDLLFADLERHEQTNKNLKRKIDEIQSEINLIKTLLVQVYFAKK